MLHRPPILKAYSLLTLFFCPALHAMQGASYRPLKLPDNQCSIAETRSKDETITATQAWLGIKKLYGQDIPNAGRISFSYSEKTRIGRISHLDVNKECRSKGCGARLLEYACKQLEQDGCTKIALSAVPPFKRDLPKLIAFYQRFGFELDEDDFVKEGPLCAGRTMHKKIRSEEKE